MAFFERILNAIPWVAAGYFICHIIKWYLNIN